MLWALLHEPRAVTAMTALAWVLVTLIGVSSLIVPPHTVQWDWGAPLTIVWACLLLTGGSLGLAGCLSGWWWVERIGITATMTGAAMYLSVVTILHLTEEGNRLPHAGFIALAMIGLGLRWWRIRGLALDPGPRRSLREWIAAEEDRCTVSGGT